MECGFINSLLHFCLQNQNLIHKTKATSENVSNSYGLFSPHHFDLFLIRIVLKYIVGMGFSPLVFKVLRSKHRAFSLQS